MSVSMSERDGEKVPGEGRNAYGFGVLKTAGLDLWEEEKPFLR